MYAQGMSGLGEAAPVAETNWMTSVGNFLQQAATTGASVYGKVQALTMQQSQAKQLQEQQQQLQAFQQANVMRQMQTGSSLGGWVLPIALGVGAIGVIWYLKR